MLKAVSQVTGVGVRKSCYLVLLNVILPSMSLQSVLAASTDQRSRSNSLTQPPDDPETVLANHEDRLSPIVRSPRRSGLPTASPRISVTKVESEPTVSQTYDPQQQNYQNQFNSQETENMRSNSMTSETVEDRLRVNLQFFFMDPIRKWQERRQIPWKLLVQLLKIIFVTTQLGLFGSMRVTHISYVEETRTVFRHLFLKGWDSSRDILQYPPASGKFAVFTLDAMYDRLEYAINQFNVLNTTAIGSFDYRYERRSPDSELRAVPCILCIFEYRKGKAYPANSTYVFNTKEQKRCLEIPVDKQFANITKLTDYLGEQNMTIQFDQLTHADIRMDIKTIHLKNLQPYNTPNCFLMKLTIIFDNSAHSGQVTMDILLDIEYISLCRGTINYAKDVTKTKALIDTLDVVVILLCLTSLILCSRSLRRGILLKNKTILYFRSERNCELSLSGRLAFLNLWWATIIVNDVFIILGTIFKMSIEFEYFDSDLFTATAILLGTGDLLVWCGILRYLGFFAHYNVMILTLKKALPNVLRFTLCAFLVYLGFAFCGWVVLGPYHYKFRSFMTTSEALFSLVNGDDMYATFDTMPEVNKTVWWFSRLYIYCFVSLFIYVILSLFISIIMDAYEVIKEVYTPKDTNSDLVEFLMEPSPTVRDAPNFGWSPNKISAATDDPRNDDSSGVFDQDQGQQPRVRFVDWIRRCCRPAADAASDSAPYNQLNND